MAKSLTSFRELFLVEGAYLNHAGTAPLNSRSVRAIEELVEHYSRRGSLPKERWDKIQEEAYSRLGRLLGAEPLELQFTLNTSEALRLAAEAIPWEEGDNLVVQADAFPAILAVFRPPPPGVELRPARTEEIPEAVDSRTKALFVDWVNYATGEAFDLALLSQLAEEKGFYLVVDLAQGAGALTLNLAELRVDFAAGTGAKWLLGVEGVGFFYASRRVWKLLERVPAGWTGLEFQSFSQLDPWAQPLPGARRLRRGSQNILGIAALSESLGILLEAGPKEVEKRVLELGEMLRTEARARGWEVRGGRSGITALRRPGLDSEEWAQKLASEGVKVSARQGWLRVSPHFYNADDEVLSVIKS